MAGTYLASSSALSKQTSNGTNRLPVWKAMKVDVGLRLTWSRHVIARTSVCARRDALAGW